MDLQIADLRKLAFMYAEKLKLAHNFCKETNLPDRDWLAIFVSRCPGISLRRPRATSINRVTASTDKNQHILSESGECL
jgi:hypothetical protein